MAHPIPSMPLTTASGSAEIVQESIQNQTNKSFPFSMTTKQSRPSPPLPALYDTRPPFASTHNRPETTSTSSQSHSASDLYHPRPIRRDHHKLTYTPPPAPMLKLVDLPCTPTPGEWIRADRKNFRVYDSNFQAAQERGLENDLRSSSNMQYLESDQHPTNSPQTPRSSRTQVHTHPSVYEFDSSLTCPPSPWSIDSGIEVTPPRPGRHQKPDRRIPTPVDEVGQKRVGMIMREHWDEVDLEEGEEDATISFVQPDERTIHATFGSEPVRRAEAISSRGGINDGFRNEEVTIEWKESTGSAGCMQPGEEEDQEEEQVWMEVVTWCPGGETCQEHHQSKTSAGRDSRFREEVTAVRTDERGWNERGEMVVSFPDVIIEPPQAISYPISSCYDSPVDQRLFAPIIHHQPSATQPQPLNHYVSPSASRPSWLPYAHGPYPNHPLTPILLQSPFRPPRWVTYSTYLSLYHYYSRPDPMLGRKGCWKCSLCGTGSRIPRGGEKVAGQRAVEISELGLMEDRKLSARSAGSKAGGGGVHARGRRDDQNPIDIFSRKGRGNAQRRVEEKNLNSQHRACNSLDKPSESHASLNDHSTSPLYGSSKPTCKRDRRISLQVEPYRRVRKAIISEEDIRRHSLHKEI